jgi:hypothetical protein
MDNAGFTRELEDLYRQAWTSKVGAGELRGALILNNPPRW